MNDSVRYPYINKEPVAVLLSCYNGNKYLEEQIQSILHQSLQTFHIYIRDDRSTDNTKEILENLIKENSSKITLMPSKKHLGAKESFFFLLKNIKSTYYMFADQDDVWFPNKIELSLKTLQREEKRTSQTLPICIFTNAKIVNKKLQSLNSDFFKEIQFNQFKKNPESIYVHNVAMGATLCFNDAVKKICFPLSKYIHMHDEWIILNVYHKKGILSPIEEPTLLYRQHSSNVIGAYHNSFFSKKNLKQIILKFLLLHKNFKFTLIKFLHYKIKYNRKNND